MRKSGHCVIFYAIMTAAIMTISASCQKTVDKQMRIVFIMGEAAIVAENNTHSPLSLKQILNKGDILKTGADSFVIIQFGGSILIRIQEKSSVEITSLFDASMTELAIREGKVLSAVHKLGKGESYWIKTPTVTAAVRGTEFSVSYYKPESVVAVRNGDVQVSTQGTQKELKTIYGGSRAVTDGSINFEPIKSSEEMELAQIAMVPPLQGIESKTEKEIIEYGKKYFGNETAAANEKYDESLMTLEQLRAKYGRIDEVTLYSGKVIAGVITKRGNKYTILTPKGEVIIPKTDINYTKEK